MNYAIDSYFSIGRNHQICQDYSVVQNNRIVLSDGCSSAPLTHLGSPILSHSHLITNFNHPLTILNAQYVASLLNLPADCLSATLLTLELKNDSFEVEVVGDGCIISRRKDSGELEYHTFQFPSNAPFYPIYNLAENKRDDWVREFGNILIENDKTINLLEIYPDGVVRKSFAIENYDMIAIFSDGIFSFTDKQNNPIYLEDLSGHFMAFKGYAGNFAQRRCRRVLKELEKDGAQHHDDFSMGAIALG